MKSVYEYLTERTISSKSIPEATLGDLIDGGIYVGDFHLPNNQKRKIIMAEEKYHKTMTYKEAKKYMKSLRAEGYSDWKILVKYEAYSILSQDYVNKIPDGFWCKGDIPSHESLIKQGLYFEYIKNKDAEYKAIPFRLTEKQPQN